MTRKDYIAIAEAFQRTIFRCDGGPGEQAVLDAAGLVADTMADDDPHFNREHFLAVVRGERSLEHFLAVVRGERDLNSHPPPKG